MRPQHPLTTRSIGALLGLAGSVAASAWALEAGPAQPDPPGCSDRPNAYVLEGRDGSGGPTMARSLLQDAGFVVLPLPLDRSPFDLRGLIFLGSRASERPEYAQYMRRHAGQLHGFVDRGNVLVQMAQSAAVEATPPFLPTTQIAQRQAEGLAQLHVLAPSSPLLGGLAGGKPQLPWEPTAAAGLFSAQGGFAVLLAGDGAANRPVLMEGAYGQGRIVLSALDLDIGDRGVARAMATAFARNLRGHVISVCRRKAPALPLTPSSARPDFVAGSWTLAVLPDTQVYSIVYPGVFTAQTAWLAGQAQRLNIRYVVHLGDIVNNNTELEWERASLAMSLLDGQLPYALAPGNHDYGPSGDASTRATLLNKHFPLERVKDWPSFGGTYQPRRLDSSYHLFSAGGQDYIIVALEWGPRDGVIQWANQIMRRHPDRLGILVTHAYLNDHGRRDDIQDRQRPQDFNPHNYATPGPVNDGEELWQKLVRHHRFVLVLNGHALGDGAGYLASTTDTGTLCHQMLSNYQMNHMGGGGYLRLLQFLPDGRTVQVQSYSPLYDRYLMEPDQAFTLTLNNLVASGPVTRN